MNYLRSIARKKKKKTVIIEKNSLPVFARYSMKKSYLFFKKLYLDFWHEIDLVIDSYMYKKN